MEQSKTKGVVVMTGKEKILDRIREDGEAAVKAINEESVAAVKEVIDQGELAAKRVADEILSAARDDCDKLRKNAESTRLSATKKALLNCRRQQIDLTLQKALEQLYTMPADQYFDKILRLAQGYKNLGGEIMFSPADLARLPEDMQSRLAQMGVTSVISDKTVDIKGGFIIKCGDIEYSADFASVAEEKREQLEDMINRNLFEN